MSAFVQLSSGQVAWPMSPVWEAWAAAMALSDRTLAATAALIGIAMLAFTNDMAARSGSGFAGELVELGSGEGTVVGQLQRLTWIVWLSTGRW